MHIIILVNKFERMNSSNDLKSKMVDSLVGKSACKLFTVGYCLNITHILATYHVKELVWNVLADVCISYIIII